MSLATTTAEMERLIERRDSLVEQKRKASLEAWGAKADADNAESLVKEGKITAEFEIRTAVNDDGKSKYKNEKEREAAIEKYLLDDPLHQENVQKYKSAKEMQFMMDRQLWDVRDELGDVRSDIATSRAWIIGLSDETTREVLGGKRHADPARWR